jgi:hypothetical protein
MRHQETEIPGGEVPRQSEGRGGPGVQKDAEDALADESPSESERLCSWRSRLYSSDLQTHQAPASAHHPRPYPTRSKTPPNRCTTRLQPRCSGIHCITSCCGQCGGSPTRPQMAPPGCLEARIANILDVTNSTIQETLSEIPLSAPPRPRRTDPRRGKRNQAPSRNLLSSSVYLSGTGPVPSGLLPDGDKRPGESGRH